MIDNKKIGKNHCKVENLSLIDGCVVDYCFQWLCGVFRDNAGVGLC